jgi:G patch domain-containing protein 1
MSAPSSRPVYVPRKSRRGRGRGGGGRFHGAFTGGFSAGYFNTVGSAEGWQPQQQQQQPPSQPGVDDDPNHDEEEVDNTPRIQRPEDFMDEQDHDEWGGPVAVQRDYRDSSSTTAIPNKLESHIDVLWSVDKAPDNVGRRLLRLLGWW